MTSNTQSILGTPAETFDKIVRVIEHYVWGDIRNNIIGIGQRSKHQWVVALRNYDDQPSRTLLVDLDWYEVRIVREG